MNNDDVICTCLGTTVGDIKTAVANGATSVEAIQEVTQAGTICGACLGEIQELIDELTK